MQFVGIAQRTRQIGNNMHSVRDKSKTERTRRTGVKPAYTMHFYTMSWYASACRNAKLNQCLSATQFFERKSIAKGFLFQRLYQFSCSVSVTIKARSKRRNWIYFNWHGSVFDELTNGQAVGTVYRRRWRWWSTWLRWCTRQPTTNELALLARWSVRQELNRVSSVQLYPVYTMKLARRAGSS